MKNKIFELFGHKVEDKSSKAEYFRKNCICPFTNNLCDGGGNRYQSFLSKNDIQKNNLTDYFSKNLTIIPPGVCSLYVKDTRWIVCPRRIFSFSKSEEINYHTGFVESLLKKYCHIGIASHIGIWSEVKIKYSENNDEDEVKSFDYTFDYIVSSLGSKPIPEIALKLKTTESKVRRQAEYNGYTISLRDSIYHIEDFPIGKLNIIEIMTSSTSGGNKDKGTTIQQSFIEAIKGNNHESPGINYRQVWARMVSQLIVKSQIGYS